MGQFSVAEYYQWPHSSTPETGDVLVETSGSALWAGRRAERRMQEEGGFGACVLLARVRQRVPFPAVS